MRKAVLLAIGLVFGKQGTKDTQYFIQVRKHIHRLSSSVYELLSMEDNRCYSIIKAKTSRL